MSGADDPIRVRSALERDDHTDYGRDGYGMIEELVIDEHGRGEGLGAALLDTCRQWLADQGICVVFASTAPEAEGFYLRHAFERCRGPWVFWTPANGA